MVCGFAFFETRMGLGMGLKFSKTWWVKRYLQKIKYEHVSLYSASISTVKLFATFLTRGYFWPIFSTKNYRLRVYEDASWHSVSISMIKKWDFLHLWGHYLKPACSKERVGGRSMSTLNNISASISMVFFSDFYDLLGHFDPLPW